MRRGEMRVCRFCGSTFRPRGLYQHEKACGLPAEVKAANEAARAARHRQSNRAWRERHPDAVLAYDRRRRAANVERARERNRRHYYLKQARLAAEAQTSVEE